MNDEQNGEQDKGLSADERERLERYASLPREMNPPAELETAVAGELRRQGLIGTQRTQRTRAWGWPGLAWVAAPALATLALGLFIGMSWVQETTGPTGELPRYLLILRSGDDYQPEVSGGTRGMEYADWAMNKLPHGAFLSGEELNETGWVLHQTGETVRSDRADFGTELREPVAGFFLIRAKDDDDAVELARTTPHLKYGGTVELRPIVERPQE